MTRISLRNGLIVVLVAFGLAACGSSVKKFDYEPVAGEMKPGAGLFSGEDGEFVIYGE